MTDAKKFYINGAWVNPNSTKEFPILSPTSEEKIGVTNRWTLLMKGNKQKDLSIKRRRSKPRGTMYNLSAYIRYGSQIENKSL